MTAVRASSSGGIGSHRHEFRREKAQKWSGRKPLSGHSAIWDIILCGYAEATTCSGTQTEASSSCQCTGERLKVGILLAAIKRAGVSVEEFEEQL